MATLKDKAIENLAAGELLLEHGYANAAASRLYYAMYEAAVHALTLRGKAPGAVRSGALEWDHSMVQNNAGSLRGSFEDRLLYKQMRELRRVADYGPAAVDERILRGCRSDVRDFVRELTR